MKVILFAGAEIRDYSFCESYMDGADAVICCDAGMRHAKALGIDPDYIVGDFDSTASEVLEYYKAKNIPIRQFPTRKNETDMELGIILARSWARQTLFCSAVLGTDLTIRLPMRIICFLF